MASKSQSRLSAKSNKSGSSSTNTSAKADGKRSNKKVTMEDEDGDEKESLAWKVLSQSQTNELLPLDVLQMQEKLKEIFSLDNHQTDLTQGSILDFYTSAVYWAVQQKFNAQQLSGFVTLVHTLLQNIKEKQMNMVDNMMEMKKMLVGVGVDDVKSGGLDFLTPDQAKAITAYVQNCLFQHYRLYLYLFSHTQAEEIIGTDLEIEVAKAADVPFPPPLDEGVLEEMYDDYIATPPPTPSPEKRPQTGDKSITSRKGTPASRAASPKSKGSARGARGATRGSSRGSTRGSSRGSTRGSAKQKERVPEEERPDPAQELERQVSQSDLFAQLTSEDVREVVESVTKEMLMGLQSEIANKLQDKEGQIIQRINKIHKVAD